METESLRAPQRESLLDTGEAMPLPRSTARRQSVRAEAKRRRRMANIMFVCSSAVAIAVIGLCYALLSQ
jgi:hypothetical protein